MIARQPSLFGVRMGLMSDSPAAGSNAGILQAVGDTRIGLQAAGSTHLGLDGTGAQVKNGRMDFQANVNETSGAMTADPDSSTESGTSRLR